MVTSWGIGPFRLRSGLLRLTEIAACAFAAALTGSRVHPRLLDLIALRSVAPERADAMAAAIRNAC